MSVKCRAKHPTAWWITCQLDQGHDGDHVQDCAPVEAGERLMFSQYTVRWPHHALRWVEGNPACNCGWFSPDTSQSSFNRHLVEVVEVDDQRRVMCGDRVLAGQWSGVVAAQHGPFSWVVIDGINVPQTHATITLRPVENPDGE